MAGERASRDDGKIWEMVEGLGDDGGLSVMKIGLGDDDGLR